MDSYRKKSSKDAKAILESGASNLDALISALSAMPYQGTTGLSQAESAFVAMIGGGDVEKASLCMLFVQSMHDFRLSSN